MEPPPHSVGRARGTSFQGYLLPLLGFIFHSVDPILELHPTRAIHQVPLTGLNPAIDLPNLVTSFHQIVEDLELVVHNPSVPEVVVHTTGVCSAHVDCHMPDRLEIPVVTK